MLHVVYRVHRTKGEEIMFIGVHVQGIFQPKQSYFV